LSALRPSLPRRYASLRARSRHPEGRALSLYERDFLEGLVLQTAVAVENAINHQRHLDYARLAQDLDAARAIQLSLLPQSMPVIPGYSVAAEARNNGLSPERLGEAVHVALTTAKPKARYAVVPQRFKNWTLPRLLPVRMLDAQLAKLLGITKP
jgi:hypothetical protein